MPAFTVGAAHALTMLDHELRLIDIHSLFPDYTPFAATAAFQASLGVNVFTVSSIDGTTLWHRGRP